MNARRWVGRENPRQSAILLELLIECTFWRRALSRWWGRIMTEICRNGQGGGGLEAGGGISRELFSEEGTLRLLCGTSSLAPAFPRA